MNKPTMNIDVAALPNAECKCGADTWQQVFVLKKLSSIQSPTGKEMVIPIDLFICAKCGEPVANQIIKGEPQ
jgi:hypothetical protein